MNIEGWNSSAVPPTPQEVVRAKMRQVIWDLWAYLDNEQSADYCQANDFDGGSPDNCTHCIRQGYINRIKEVTKLDEEVEG